MIQNQLDYQLIAEAYAGPGWPASNEDVYVIWYTSKIVVPVNAHTKSKIQKQQGDRYIWKVKKYPKYHRVIEVLKYAFDLGYRVMIADNTLSGFISQPDRPNDSTEFQPLQRYGDVLVISTKHPMLEEFVHRDLEDVETWREINVGEVLNNQSFQPLNDNDW